MQKFLRQYNLRFYDYTQKYLHKEYNFNILF